jgi:hypothetical protein
MPGALPNSIEGLEQHGRMGRQPPMGPRVRGTTGTTGRAGAERAVERPANLERDRDGWVNEFNQKVALATDNPRKKGHG